MEQTALPATYRVSLAFFEGPLDLLLYLVRRNELESRTIPLHQITSQFLEFLSVLQLLDLELASDFVVVASTLLEIKSRDILPSEEESLPPEEEVAASDSPASDLIRKMLEYRRFRDAALAIENQAVEWQQRYPRLADERPVIGKNPSADRIKEVELWDLVSALGRILRKTDVQAEGRILYDDTPIEVYVQQIGERVQNDGEVLFTTLFDKETIRSRIVGMFLAILELLRHHGYRAVQEGLYGEIRVFPPLPKIAEESDADQEPHGDSVNSPQSAEPTVP